MENRKNGRMKGVKGYMVGVWKRRTSRGIESVESRVKRGKTNFKEGMYLREKGQASNHVFKKGERRGR